MKVAKPNKAEKGDYNDHPTVKPVGIIDHLIRLFTTEGQTILDPFMGSGSHGVAAKITGREFIGVERDEKYYDLCVRRISEAVNKKTEFDIFY